MKIVGSIVVYKFYRLPKKERECFSEDSSARNDGDASRSTTIDIEQKEDNDDVMEGQNILYMKPRPMNFLKMTISGMILCIVLYSTSRSFP